MVQFKTLYLAISWLLLISQLLILFALAYTRLQLGLVMYFGNPDDLNPAYQKYFKTLELLLYSTIILVIAWGILTPFAVIANRKLEKERIKIAPGSAGFLLAVLLLILDPFGMFKWFTG